MVRFDENEVRAMSRGSSGVKGIDLDESYVVGADVINSGEEVLVVTENGYGKRTTIDEYRLTHRGSKGVKALNMTDKNGLLTAFMCVEANSDCDAIIVTDSGIVIKMPIQQISLLKRATQGVKLINLKDDQKVATVAVVEKISDDTIEE